MTVEVNDDHLLIGEQKIPFGDTSDWPTFLTALTRALKADGLNSFSIHAPNMFTDDSNYGDVSDEFLRGYLNAAETARKEYLDNATEADPATHQGLFDAIKIALADKHYEECENNWGGDNYDEAFRELEGNEFDGVFEALSDIFDVDSDEITSDVQDVFRDIFAEQDESTIFDIFPSAAKLKVCIPIGEYLNEGELCGGDDLPNIIANNPLGAKYAAALGKEGGKAIQERILDEVDIDVDNVTFNLPVFNKEGEVTSDALEALWQTRFLPDVQPNEKGPLEMDDLYSLFESIGTGSPSLIYAGNLRFLDILLRDFQGEGITVREGIIATHEFGSGSGHIETFEGEFTLPANTVIADSGKKYGLEATYGLTGRAWRSEIVSKNIKQILLEDSIQEKIDSVAVKPAI